MLFRSGDAGAHSNLGVLLKRRMDFDGAEAAYHAAIAADPGLADAHYNLGVLLEYERQDLDGAEAAYRAAIAVDPGFADAHCNLGALFATHAEQREASGGDLSDIAALWAQVVEHFTNGVSAGADDHGVLKRAKGEVARIQEAISQCG